jgi:hypothetical protein
MAVQDNQIGNLNERSVTVDHLSRWHLWTVIIPRRSITGKLVSGQLWRRRQGTKWVYKKFVEYADRDITGSRSERPMGKLVIKATILISAVVGSTASLFVVSWFGLSLLGF